MFPGSQADRMLDGFGTAVQRLDAALGRLPDASLAALPDTADDIKGLRLILQRTTFALPDEHVALLGQFRAACDGVKAYAISLEDKGKDIIQAVGGWE